MIVINHLNIVGTNQAKIWLNNLVIIIENSCGSERALDFAEKYGSQSLLCRIVFELGREKYDYIHRCVNNWGLEFLNTAIDTIYQQEKIAVREKKPNYQFQLFEIFEDRYYRELREYIAPRNKKLLTLLSLRHAEANEAHLLLRNEVIPKIECVETMKVLSSVALSNLENCVESPNLQMKKEDAQYLNSKLYIAEIQSQVLPQEEKLIQEMTPNYLIQVLNFSTVNNIDKEQRLRTVFKMINNERADSRANIQELKHFAWKSLVSTDADSISLVNERISGGDSEFLIYSESDIKQSIEKTLIYQFAIDSFNKASALDDDT